MAKRIVDALGDEASVAHAQTRIAAEEELHQHVGRAVELQNDAERARELVNDQARDADLSRLERRHALFGRLRPLFVAAHGAGLLAAALVGGALALRAAGRLGALGLAGLLHRKGATLRELGFSHMYSAVVKAKRKRPEPAGPALPP